MTLKPGTCHPERFSVRVQIERPRDVALDAAGQVDLSDDANWEDAGQAFAAVTTRGGQERWDSDQLQATADAVFELRWSQASAAITPQYRLRANGQVWHVISSEDVDFRHVVQRVLCRRAAP